MEGGEDNTSNDFSATFYMNYGSNSNNHTYVVPIIDPFAHTAIGWPAQSSHVVATTGNNQMHSAMGWLAQASAVAAVNNQNPTPFQDLLADAMVDQSHPNSNNQTLTQFQDLLSEDVTNPHTVTPPSQNIDLNRAFESHQNGIDGNLNPGTSDDHLNPFSNDAFNSTPIVISSGIAGYVVEETNNSGEGHRSNGRRLSCKRRAPEESSSTRGSSHSLGESSRSRLRPVEDQQQEDDNDRTNSEPEYEETFILDPNMSNQQQQWGARPVVLGLAAPTQQDREEHALRARIMARARQMAEDNNRVRRHMQYRRQMVQNAEVNALWHQGVAYALQQQLQPPQPQQPIIFPYESAPGAFHPAAPPPSQLPVPHPIIPQFSESVQPFQWHSAINFNSQPTYNVNRQDVTVSLPLVEAHLNYMRNIHRVTLPHEIIQRGSLEQMLTNGSNIASSLNSNNVVAMPPPHLPPPPVQLVPVQGNGNIVEQYGQIISNGALTDPEAIARAHYCLQHLGISVNPRARDTGMIDGNVAAQQSVGLRISGSPPRTRVQTEIAIRAAAQRRRRLIAEVRNALALVHRAGSVRFEDVLVIDGSVLYGYNDEGDDDHEEMRLDVDDMTYEELLALEERIGNVSTGLSDAAIRANMKQHKHKSTEMASSSANEPCCICQEEYVDGEDVGKLECGHKYHFNCIRQWLARKNNCPICKRTALRI